MSHERTWKDNAAEFAALDRGEGWQFAILVACSVEVGASTGRPSKTSAIDEVSRKVSVASFAREAGTADSRVRRYLNAWQEAGERGWVPDATTLTPADANKLTVPDRPWKKGQGGVYDASATGGQINRTDQIAEKAAKDPEYRERLFAAVNKATGEIIESPKSVPTATTSKFTDQELAEFQRRGEQRPTPVPSNSVTVAEFHHLLSKATLNIHDAARKLRDAALDDLDKQSAKAEISKIRGAVELVEHQLFSADVDLDAELEKLLSGGGR